MRRQESCRLIKVKGTGYTTLARARKVIEKDETVYPAGCNGMRVTGSLVGFFLPAV
jgi:hypothetical protein